MFASYHVWNINVPDLSYFDPKKADPGDDGSRLIEITASDCDRRQKQTTKKYKVTYNSRRIPKVLIQPL